MYDTYCKNTTVFSMSSVIGIQLHVSALFIDYPQLVLKVIKQL